MLVMNHVERFRAVMNFESVDRLPRWEWAMWWDKTIERWHKEGLPGHLKFNDVFGISEYFGLDPYMQFWFSTTEATIEATQHHVEGVVSNMDDYLKVKPRLYPDHSQAIASMRRWAEQQKDGRAVVWATLEGFFWFPRTLMNIERLSYAFYDQPELVHAINRDLLEFNLNLVRQMAEVCVPTFMTLAEDMSYNHGPMISKETFDEFLAPYYRKLMPVMEELNIIPIVDTDGDVALMVPWLEGAGIVGVLPLERQAGVDGMLLRQQFPELRMIGHFDKMVMNQGEEAMLNEFERLRPVMKTGGFIPSVDHQTPPGVSIEEYRCYLRLLEEYSVRGAQ
jgi:uroporphyrinogen-III decarboxylase